jgi:hypothetical protein
MSKLIQLDLDPPQRLLRQFGFIACGAFSLLALCAWQQWLMFDADLGAARAPVAGALVALGAGSLLFSLVAPRANWALYVGLSVVTYPIGFVLSYVIMGLLFYGIVAPTGLLMRLAGRELMPLGFERERASYWLESRPPRPAESYFKQF